MCAGAIVHTRIERVIYGLGDPKAGAAGSAMNILQCPGLNHRCEITPGVREQESLTMIQAFFSQKRSSKQSN